MNNCLFLISGNLSKNILWKALFSLERCNVVDEKGTLKLEYISSAQYLDDDVCYDKKKRELEMETGVPLLAVVKRDDEDKK